MDIRVSPYPFLVNLVCFQVWKPQHEQAGKDMYELCVTLRGFYLKAGQFIGSRTDFVPEQVRHAGLLCPPPAVRFFSR